MKNKLKYSRLFLVVVIGFIVSSCGGSSAVKNVNKNYMKEIQVTFDHKTHALDNNDNYSSDGLYLSYDTRGMVFNNNLANCKSIEKVEITTSDITVLWEPESITGENAAPGVAAVSYHPTSDKVIFIHGPFLDEVQDKGYYNIRNRTGKVVSADGKRKITNIDMRDTSVDKPTTPGAHRGGTHRHEYSRNGKRIGFTYDDFIQQGYDRSIGYLEENKSAPKGYTHYFSVLLKPAKKGTSKPGEIEKAYSDSWIDEEGTVRAFIGKVRAENGVDYESSLFVAEIPENIDIATSFSGDKDSYPTPPKGVIIRRLTHSISDDGIVRGSFDGKNIAYLSQDENGVMQVFVIAVDGSDLSDNSEKRPKKVTNFKSDASNIRWQPSDKRVFSISNGKIYASMVKGFDDFGKTTLLTPNDDERGELVVSPKGDQLAYTINIEDENSQLIVDGKIKNTFSQIFVMDISQLK